MSNSGKYTDSFIFLWDILQIKKLLHENWTLALGCSAEGGL